MTLRNTDDFAQSIGAQVRRLRIRAELTQADLADRAGLTPLTIHKLEAGRGSSLRTLIRVVRVLNEVEWLDALAPDRGPSPLQVLRESRGEAPRQRVRRSSGRR